MPWVRRSSRRGERCSRGEVEQEAEDAQPGGKPRPFKRRGARRGTCRSTRGLLVRGAPYSLRKGLGRTWRCSTLAHWHRCEKAVEPGPQKHPSGPRWVLVVLPSVLLAFGHDCHSRPNSRSLVGRADIASLSVRTLQQTPIMVRYRSSPRLGRDLTISLLRGTASLTLHDRHHPPRGPWRPGLLPVRPCGTWTSRLRCPWNTTEVSRRAGEGRPTSRPSRPTRTDPLRRVQQVPVAAAAR